MVLPIQIRPHLLSFFVSWLTRRLSFYELQCKESFCWHLSQILMMIIIMREAVVMRIHVPLYQNVLHVFWTVVKNL